MITPHGLWTDIFSPRLPISLFDHSKSRNKSAIATHLARFFLAFPLISMVSCTDSKDGNLPPEDDPFYTITISLALPDQLLESPAIVLENLSVEVSNNGNSQVVVRQSNNTWTPLEVDVKSGQSLLLEIIWRQETNGQQLNLATASRNFPNITENLAVSVDTYSIQFDDDEDGLTNLDEINAGTDPYMPTRVIDQSSAFFLVSTALRLARDKFAHEYSFDDEIEQFANEVPTFDTPDRSISQTGVACDSSGTLDKSGVISEYSWVFEFKFEDCTNLDPPGTLSGTANISYAEDINTQLYNFDEEYNDVIFTNTTTEYGNGTIALDAKFEAVDDAGIDSMLRKYDITYYNESGNGGAIEVEGVGEYFIYYGRNYFRIAAALQLQGSSIENGVPGATIDLETDPALLVFYTGEFTGVLDGSLQLTASDNTKVIVTATSEPANATIRILDPEGVTQYEDNVPWNDFKQFPASVNAFDYQRVAEF